MIKPRISRKYREKEMTEAYKKISLKLKKNNLTQNEFYLHGGFWGHDFTHIIKMTFNNFKKKYGFAINNCGSHTKGEKRIPKPETKTTRPYVTVKCHGYYCDEREFKCFDLDRRGIPLYMCCPKCRKNQGVEI